MVNKQLKKLLILPFFCRHNASWTCGQGVDSAIFLALPISLRLSKAGELCAREAVALSQ